jgi:hypothetical protein
MSGGEDGSEVADAEAAAAGAAGAATPDELRELARRLEQAAREIRRHARQSGGWAAAFPPPAADAPAPTAAQVRALIAARRLREGYLPDLQGDHAFAMLLELYAARQGTP